MEIMLILSDRRLRIVLGIIFLAVTGYLVVTADFIITLIFGGILTLFALIFFWTAYKNICPLYMAFRPARIEISLEKSEISK